MSRPRIGALLTNLIRKEGKAGMNMQSMEQLGTSNSCYLTEVFFSFAGARDRVIAVAKDWDKK